MPLPHLTICEGYSGHLLHNWNKDDLIAPIGSLSVLMLCWDGATSACRTQLKTSQNECFSDCYEIPPRLLLSCSSGSLSRDKNTRLESKELHDMSLKARMNVMPCSGRKSAKVSICHSLLCHARRRMRPKHPQTCCKLVHLGFGACMHLFFCELSLCNGRNIRSRFLVYGDGSQQLSQEKLCWLWVQKVASSFEAVSKEMYWWAASS